MRQDLTINLLKKEAAQFAEEESHHSERSIYGVTDGKAVGTYFEHKFMEFLRKNYRFEEGSSAKGIDFPGLLVDMKVTSVRQPQSSCPFKSARQKVFGLGYSLLVFVYEKTDIARTRRGKLDVRHTIFVEAERTGDYQTTRGMIEIVAADGNIDDLVAFMTDRRLPVDEIEATKIAKRVLTKPPVQGYLTISNALQWRLQYRRVIDMANTVDGVVRLS